MASTLGMAPPKHAGARRDPSGAHSAWDHARRLRTPPSCIFHQRALTLTYRCPRGRMQAPECLCAIAPECLCAIAPE
eukprot:2609187-Pleurochrysis_carterae.AAC.1